MTVAWFIKCTAQGAQREQKNSPECSSKLITCCRKCSWWSQEAHNLFTAQSVHSAAMTCGPLWYISLHISALSSGQISITLLMASGRTEHYRAGGRGEGGHQQVLWLWLAGTVAGLCLHGPTNYLAAVFSTGLHTEQAQTHDRLDSGKKPLLLVVCAVMLCERCRSEMSSRFRVFVK